MTEYEQTIGNALVQIARFSLEAYVRHRRHYHPDLADLPPALQEPGASFVTLTRKGRLRGCIGTTQAREPLVRDVARNAIAAASRDPRFSPVSITELADVRLEVTVLTPPRLLSYEHYEHLLRQLRPQIDGVMLTWGSRRGLLLPQVWGRITQPDQFLEAIAYKADIPARELLRRPPLVQVHTFQVKHYREPGYREPGS